MKEALSKESSNQSIWKSKNLQSITYLFKEGKL